MKLATMRRLAWRLAGAALAPIRYRSRPNPYAHFRRLPDASAVHSVSEKQDGRRVLLLPIRVSSASNLLEGVIGAGLKLDGHQVYALLDGGVLRYSENVTHGKSWFVANALSVYEQQQLCDTFGIAPCYFDDFIDAREFARQRDIISALTFDELVAFRFKDIAVGRHARFGLVRYLRQETVDLPENAPLLREFLLTAIRTAMAVEAVVRSKQITHAFLSHGIYSTWGVATDVLVALGVQVSVWGRGYVGGDPLLGRNQSYLQEAITETTDDVRRFLAPYAIDEPFLDNYFSAKAQPGSKVDVESYYDARSSSVAEEVAQLRQGYRGLVSVFPNIPWDGTMFAASSYTPSLRAFARKVVQIAGQFPQIRFVVRCHPAERHRMGNNSREAFASFFSDTDRAIPNLIILDAESHISSYDLLPATDAALVFGTTMGLELAFRALPVIQTGRFHLSNKGAVYEVSSDEELADLMRQLEAGQLAVSAEMRENIRRYAFYHIRLCHVHDDMIEVNRYSFERYRFDRAEMLQGDTMKSCAAIKQFVLGHGEKCLNPYVAGLPS